jgi:ATP-dependent RNA helicase DHX8/PRP22
MCWTHRKPSRFGLSAPLTAGSTTQLRMALAIGFANRLARRLPTHNGYRTLGESASLATLHPGTARIDADEDGLLPEWCVYHELVATSRVFLTGVCPVEAAWAEAMLPKLRAANASRLSGGVTAAREAVPSEKAGRPAGVVLGSIESF